MTRKMRVNGARPGDEEGLSIFEKSKNAWRSPCVAKTEELSNSLGLEGPSESEILPQDPPKAA